MNTSNFTATNPINNVEGSFGFVNVNASTDTNNDGVANADDIDDDNDTILDILEYDGLDPLEDDDSDFIPNYRDTDFGVDANGDGIVDVFDFDSDNDGVLDIIEAGISITDNNNNGRTEDVVGANGLDNTLENNDTASAVITYTIPNTDLNGNPDF